MEEYIKDIIFIVYGLVLGTLGNLLYRANNHLHIWECIKKYPRCI